MASLNKVMLIGRLGKDPAMRSTTSGKFVCNLSLATSEKRKDKDEITEWHNVTVWDQLAVLCGKYLKKGREVYVEGRIQTRKYEKNGVDHNATDIIASQVVFLSGGGKDGDSEASSSPINDDPFAAPSKSATEAFSDIPF